MRIESTVRWYTGPRCPKCESKHLEIIEPGKRFKCPRCGAEFSLGEAKRGLGALFWVNKELADKYFGGSKRLGDIEFLVNNYQLIPPSIHPTGVRYEWIKPIDLDADNYGIYALIEADVQAIANDLGLRPNITTSETPEKTSVKMRELSDSDLLQLKEKLKEAYKPGYRQLLILYLSGWLAKADVSPISAVKLVKMLYDETQDEDPLRTRLAGVVYSYKKAGIDMDAYAEPIFQLTGVLPYGLEKEVSVDADRVKGVSGVQEILDAVLGEERSLVLIKEIEDVLRVSSPYHDSIIELLDYEKQLFTVANLKAGIIARARLNGERLVYKERVTVVAPTKIVVYSNPIGGITKYEITFEGKTLRKPLTIGPASIDEISDRLRAEGLVYHSKLLNDVLNAIVQGAIRRERAEVREEIEAPGFYFVNNKIRAVKIELRQVSKDEIRDALLTLNELAEWYKHIIEKFTMVVKWGLIAPFSYTLKQRGIWIPWLYLYGASHTGKTTLGEIILAIWGLGSQYVKTGANIDTVARLGYVLSQSTFPMLINEPGGALIKDEIVEVLKSAIESTIVRGKYVRGSYIEMPSLAPLIFASNKVLPRDDALLRRFIVITFTIGEKIPEEKAHEFTTKIKTRLRSLEALGFYVAEKMINEYNGEIDDWQGIAEKILMEAYNYAGLEIPEWITTKYKAEENIYDDIKETIRNFLVKRINDEYNRFVGRVTVETPNGINYQDRTYLNFSERVNIVISNNLLPWAILRGDEVLITTGIINELRGIAPNIENLKSIAELLGWEYRSKFSRKIGGKVVSYSVIAVPISTFIEFLLPSP
jgi:predicted RNA-binding Zn-ribbon protein involved in translation (DUF1610 family)